MDGELLGCIVRLKNALEREKSGNTFNSDYDYEDTEDYPINDPQFSGSFGKRTNRGNKLFDSYSKVDRTRLGSEFEFFRSGVTKSLGVHGSKIVFTNNLKRKHYKDESDEISQKRRTQAKQISNGNKKSKGEEAENESEDSEDDTDDNPFNLINVGEILEPIQDPTDIATRPTIRRTYDPKTSKNLQNLSLQTIQLIEKEQETVVQLFKLMDFFLGDDYNNFHPDHMKLPEYDHHLSFDDLDRQLESANIRCKTTVDNSTSTTSQASSIEANKEPPVYAEAKDKRITRSQANEGVTVTDPFFQTPEFVKDPNFGISDPKDAESTRQLLQITLQRNEEFIRCLTTIRNGMVRTERMKNSIFKWCREMNGETDINIEGKPMTKDDIRKEK
ncbi:Histone deacetylase complex subunit [Komagataella phaffii CBS 7435]|uniref:Subunit of the histone deacetylase Rpd3L complex n=2 Tax=Komagataella phaffii TaxID=460519 RepID=C4R6Y7_KOMPG|nr:Subunit of the histone deacetylase Rpd3L complex [Komagataella phaffii GS115]AOA64854.1 GQ67_04446T0 [Komagataella phaffii]CAH2451292.1 Histone deacetylase complex subunit [Komagataella phaffii CBS 7435]AOA69499.1 GQ68_04418T0 [Komagataella phaffii GS115]CAY71362.1 Subunit of the histone deacetylase Rpd3L complex [Komagataella phaffii GS115]CCA41031.1 Histone deacetylase complex subunit [Komagataella phaffii CBS 7435]